ncbi:MAG: glycosyltransferase [Candidatus Daviesbacteria bacterium]|nr:glycosyltransferase [Candidatus Daviesbacteria bacterium]
MKILFGTDNFYPNVNGSANFAYELAKGLVKNGHNISVIAPSRKFKYTITKHEGMTIYGIHSVMIPKIIYPSGIRIPLVLNPAGIKTLVKQINPEVIHIQDHFIIDSTIARVGRKLGIPLVGTNHFMPENLIHYFYPPGFAKKPLSKFAWRQFINVYKHLDLITTPTKTAAQLIENLGLGKPIISISCGVNLDRFNPKNNGNYLKKRYKIADSKLVVLFVGRLDKEKNIDVVIKAFSNVLNSINAELVIAGKGKEKLNLVNLTRKLGIDKNVTFTGFVSDKELPYLYRIADVFTIASIAELQSIATMEAMASGLPIVAARVMALPELVHDGKNGYLFGKGDTNALANQIIKILKNPTLRKKMSASSLKIISQHSLDKTIQSYEKIYQSLITT